MTYTLAWEPHGVVKTFSGFVTGREFVLSAEAIAADARFDDLRFIVNDFLGISGHSISGKDLEDIAAIRFGSMQTNPNIRVLVIAADPTVLALVEAVSRPPLLGSHETTAFGSLDEARAWLGKQPVLGHVRRS